MQWPRRRYSGLIIVRVSGGLGNQMFQYAAGKATALALGVELLLDPDYDKFTERNGRFFMLNFFRGILDREVSATNAIKMFPALAFYSGIRRKSLTIRALGKIFRHIFYGLGMQANNVDWAGTTEHPLATEHLFSILSSKVYFQKASEFYDDFDSIPDNTYMIGYWESEKFFDSIKTRIRSIYSFDAALYESPLHRQLNFEQSVSIHIRRGDKVNHKTLFPSDLNYVASAARIMRSKLGDPVFYVFSDDIPWCKENLPHMLNMPLSFVEGHEAKDACKDMFFMSQCKHNIIGPSTFSWWAAWLNPNPNKIVVAPHQKLWDLNKPGGSNLLPREWLALE
jgi:hypothetical protein